MQEIAITLSFHFSRTFWVMLTVEVQKSTSLTALIVCYIMSTVLLLQRHSVQVYYNNISIKIILKNVGMTVPKIRETRAIYMWQHRG